VDRAYISRVKGKDELHQWSLAHRPMAAHSTWTKRDTREGIYLARGPLALVEGVAVERRNIMSDQITSTPGVLQGKPCIAGTRISVELILEQLALGDTIDDLIDDYPHITREQILAALAFAHDQLHEKYLQEHIAS